MLKRNTIKLLILSLSFIFILSGCSLYGPEETVEIDPPPLTLEYDDTNLNQDNNTNVEQNLINNQVTEEQETVQQTIYFFDDAGDVVPLTLDIPKVEGIGQEVINYMIGGGPAEEILPDGFRPVIPEGTTFSLNVKQEEKLAIVDFSKKFLDYEALSADDEKKILDAIIWSLTEFPTVEKVEIRINGYQLEEMPVWNTPVIAPLSRTDGINLELANNISIGNTTPITLYFNRTVDNFTYYVPVTRLIPRTDNIAEATIEQLIIGPKSGSNLTSDILPTTKLLGVEVSDDLLVADFDDELLGFDEQLSLDLINMIVLSLSENTNIPSIQIKIMGESKFLPDELTKPIIRPEKINATVF